MAVRKMLIVETIAKIRRYYFVEGRKVKQIKRQEGRFCVLVL